ncbi:MAG: hypothetical protein R6W70_02320 [bacterium]
MVRCRTYAGYFLLFTSLVMIGTVFIFNGSAYPFFSLTYKILGVVFSIALGKAGISAFFKKNFMSGFLHVSWMFLLVFCMVNEREFVHVRVPAGKFDEIMQVVFPEKKIRLLSHELKQKGNLTGYEHAVVEKSGVKHEVTLNNPLKITKHTAIYVTGQGEEFLLTTSPYLYVVLVFAVISTFFLALWAFNERRII